MVLQIPLYPFSPDEGTQPETSLVHFPHQSDAIQQPESSSPGDKGLKEMVVRRWQEIIHKYTYLEK